jgi:small subunit ribosomal protein S3
MGQKMHPSGMRLQVTKDWKSYWFVPKDQYGDIAYNDYIIRQFIRKELRAAGIQRIEIRRFMKKIEITIRVARPGVVIGRGGTQIEEIKEKLNKIVDGKVELKVTEVRDPDISARLIADRLAEQLERRSVPKLAMANELNKAVNTGKIEGIRIWVSGRIKGSEIARTEKTFWGRIPLQKLNADIDYALSEAQVPNAGKHGIKVWVYKGDL